MQQVVEDTREMSDYMRDKEHLWGAMLGNVIFQTCYDKLPGPAKMLQMFQKLAEEANKRKQYLSWVVPSTGFPVVQGYRKPNSIRTKLKYGEEELKIIVESWDEATLDEGASITGAAPNIVHSFDAGHLSMVVANSDYPISVIHDSFGAHFGNMDKLFKDVRHEFAEFYRQDPLMEVLKQMKCEHLMPERGSLDIDLIKQSDYAFR